jgi:type IV pilus assembly protein PilB
MPDTILKYIRDSITRPYGLILISGPTGSGKTTTLYSMLNEINKDEQNVLSLEDPIEYNIEGMSQSQVFPEIGYTFATGLRTTLRQDPDVIMVGEIRDKETAGLAVQAALTGHLVLATIHTNNSIGVIPRLIDMGVDPYLIAPTLILALAQRLTRTLYPGTGKAIPVEGSIKAILDNQFKDLPEQYKKDLPKFENVYEPEATTECATGVKGRVAVFEGFKMDKEIEKLILTNPTDTALYDLLRGRGMLSMREDAMIKALSKKIPWSEVNAL